MVFLVAVGLGLVLSGTPVAAQPKGNGPLGAKACSELVPQCPNQSQEVFGACVSFVNVCTNAEKTNNANLSVLCNMKANLFSILCGLK